MEPTQNQNIYTTPVATQQVPPVPVSAPPPPKRKFPKIIVILGALLLLGVLIFIITRLFSGGLKSQGAEIVWWGLWEDENIIAPLISEYETKNSNIKIKYVRQSQRDYRERLTSAMAKGEGPDIFRFHNTWAPMFRNELDALPASVMNPADFAKTFRSE